MSGVLEQLIEKVSVPPPVYRRFLPYAPGAVSPPSMFIPADPTPMAREFLRDVREFRAKFAALDGEGEEIRESSRETAATLWGWACAYYGISDELARLDEPISQVLAKILEEVAVELEDIAETEALAGSESFAQSVKEELAPYLPAEGSDPGA